MRLKINPKIFESEHTQSQLGELLDTNLPAAVLSMIILRSMRLKDVSILENNLVQTMASAGESLAAGVIFTVPALLVMGMEMPIRQSKPVQLHWVM